MCLQRQMILSFQSSQQCCSTYETPEFIIREFSGSREEITRILGRPAIFFFLYQSYSIVFKSHIDGIKCVKYFLVHEKYNIYIM